MSRDDATPRVDYALRGVDRELWTRVKTRAAAEGRSIRYVLVELLKIYARHGFHVVETFDRDRK